MSLDLSSNNRIKILNPHASVDDLYGPYVSKDEALAALEGWKTNDSIGLTVGILDNTVPAGIKEYWWNGSTLILKITGTDDISEYVTDELGALDTSLKEYVTDELGALDTSLKEYVTDELGALDTSLKEYVTDELGALAGALVYKGNVSKYSELPTNPTTGDTYIAIADIYVEGTFPNHTENGDFVIYNGTSWLVVQRNTVHTNTAVTKLETSEIVPTTLSVWNTTLNMKIHVDYNFKTGMTYPADNSDNKYDGTKLINLLLLSKEGIDWVYDHMWSAKIEASPSSVSYSTTFTSLTITFTLKVCKGTALADCDTPSGWTKTSTGTYTKTGTLNQTTESVSSGNVSITVGGGDPKATAANVSVGYTKPKFYLVSGSDLASSGFSVTGATLVSGSATISYLANQYIYFFAYTGKTMNPQNMGLAAIAGQSTGAGSVNGYSNYKWFRTAKTQSAGSSSFTNI